jgi:hypothetical protein
MNRRRFATRYPLLNWVLQRGTRSLLGSLLLSGFPSRQTLPGFGLFAQLEHAALRRGLQGGGMRFASTQRWWLASEMPAGELSPIVRRDSPGPSPQPPLHPVDRIRRRDSLSTAPPAHALLVDDGTLVGRPNRADRSVFDEGPRSRQQSRKKESAYD